MARVKEYTDRIREAIYGEEVRGSIADAIDMIDNVAEGDRDSAKAYAEETKEYHDTVETKAAQVAEDRTAVEGLRDEVQTLKEETVAEAERIVEHVAEDAQKIIDDGKIEVEKIVTEAGTDIDAKVESAKGELDTAVGEAKNDIKGAVDTGKAEIIEAGEQAAADIGAMKGDLEKIRDDTQEIKDEADVVYEQTLDAFHKTQQLQIVSVGGLTFSITPEMLLRVSWEG